MKFIEKLDSDKVRAFCIENDLCTRATCEEYQNILGMAKQPVKKAIPVMAALIAEKSTTEITKAEIAGALFNRCCRRWIEEAE